MKYGITDIGSNTIRFNIYGSKNGKYKHLISKKNTAGLISYKKKGKLSKKGIKVLISTLKKFKKHLKELEVDKTYYFATACLRNVDNTNEVLDIVKKETGIKIHVLTSDQEATLTFEALKDKDLDRNEGVLIDVGGGSSEITVFENNALLDDVSLPVGSLLMYEEYVSMMFPNKEEKKAIHKRVVKEIAKSGIEKYDQEIMFGVGGTVRAINKMLIHLNLKDDNSPLIPISLLDTLLDELKTNTKEDFDKVLQVKAERIHTLIPGLIIIKTIAEYFEVDYMHVTHHSIREGVLHSIIQDK
ncbi:exopolyphosphatase [uncultured Methanobrevibacter sp.]|uniref:Ppx/GppA phosphatase family protein n=1 Tax=uncultured Methanobrevibacter sp. TaxID=253161 RepID=UPI0025FCE4A6|nr:exopolyphosphatase [uncultured Methanobrevibacter sp.]